MNILTHTHTSAESLHPNSVRPPQRGTQNVKDCPGSKPPPITITPAAAGSEVGGGGGGGGIPGRRERKRMRRDGKEILHKGLSSTDRHVCPYVAV